MNNIEQSFYLSDSKNLNYALEVTDLAQDELESIVGRFARHSSRAGQLRGEIVIFIDGSLAIRHHFTKKLLWTNKENL